MRPSRLFLSVIAMCIMTGSAAGQGRLLQTACTDADAVVVGTIQPVLLTSTPALFTIAVDTVIKGEVSSHTTVTVSWPGSLTAARMRPDQYRALWFLHKTGSGGWEISPIGGTKAPLFASGLAVPPAGQSVGAQPQAATCYGAVWAVLKQNAAHIDESPPYLTAMETLLQDSPVTMAASLPDFASTVHAFTLSPSANLRALALASRIRGEDAQALARVAAEQAAIIKSQAGHQVGFALAGWRNSEPAGLAALGTIAQAPGGGLLSQSAAQALMMIHTKDAVPHLAGLLTSTDPSLRDAAVRGLSLFVRGAPILSAANLRAMAYLTEGQNREFLDEAIVPYVTITPIPNGKEREYASAWIAWWNRMAGNWAK